MGLTSESSTRLWEELTPVPYTPETQSGSFQPIAVFMASRSYCGIFTASPWRANGHPEGQGERIHPTMPIYANREARPFAYWDHESRMPWQTQEYYDSQKKTLRAGTYLHRMCS
ncbi:MAG TPA: hypothetical protein VEO92_05730 [Candidatus Nitrosocosmicus sp.]|nr:hypothetical protein [Candidatus Nitrosocosmicus sp.]